MAELDVPGTLDVPDSAPSGSRRPTALSSRRAGVGSANVFVAEPVHGGRLTIQGEPHQTVYWHVSAVRDDVYARANPMHVEIDKVGDQRGRYLTPEVHGATANRRIGP